MSAQPPTPWAQPSAPARWRWHVRMWGGPRGTGHAPGTGDRLLGAGSGRRNTLGHCCSPGGTAPGLGTHRGRALGLCSPPGVFEGPRCCCTGISPWVPACPVCPPAGLPGRPGTPEIAQKYKNTVLVLWKPAESKAPCTYTLERRLEGTWPVKEWPHAAWGHPLAGLQALPLHGWVLGAWGSVLGGDRRLRPASPAP